MRTERQVKEKLRMIAARHLRKRTEDFLTVTPERCVHCFYPRNVPVSMGFCGYKAEGRPRWVVCDSRFPGGNEQAQSCPWWTAKKTREEIEAEFHNLLRGDRGDLAIAYPDIAALVWMCDTDPTMQADLFAILSDDVEDGK